MTLPSSETPLYNHPLPDIEEWLRSHGGEQDQKELHYWRIGNPNWTADLWLEIDQITVRYIGAATNGQDIQRSFKYSLSRQDLESTIFGGP
ncbi:MULTISPECIES: DUF3143 domain-containing protein [Planktothrix]|uniref:DUF3143 domain-containing protein n=1 Tax=Planktothrix rubescens CCAP 1459/22 TaxID=329571 RepID=A0A6J7ZM91_PLARU|nr:MULTISPECIES: DUF3143 domain-containing protein [Planktothrix]CAC5343067.1 conserved hypothetical protein [Planktothrix rubescens NIVA-CYA 18]CAD5976299.1 hypothetical protein PCC7821_04157 [Planktothrix rubescens NIVA-CYA 18]